MVFIPECADYVETTKELSVAAAEPLDGDLVGRYKKLAARLNVWLSIGSFHERPSNFEQVKKIYNTHLIIDGYGTIKGIYRKVGFTAVITIFSILKLY